ncbi:MAG: thioesterase family protein [Ilumatobacteraceae bacterium]
MRARWPESDRLGLFPGSSPERLRLADDGDLASARLVHAVGAALPAGATGLVADDSTARGCTPVHLVPLVEIDGPHAAALTELYRSMGMAPIAADAPAHERWQLGEGLVQLTDGDPDAVIAVMRALRPSGKGAGEAIAHHEAVRFASGAPSRWQPGEVPAAPLALYRTPVEPEWVDYNAHMTESAYLTAAGWASDALFRYIGDDEAYRAAGHSFYTVETHIHYVREVAVHEPIEFHTQIIGVDAKRVHLIHSMLHGDDGGLLCTAEQMLVHVDMEAGRSAPILPDVAAALQAIAASHAALPIPTQVGSVMRLPARKETPS